MDSGTPVTDVCWQVGICEAPFYVWKKKYGELGVSELREIRQLRDEDERVDLYSPQSPVIEAAFAH